MDKSVIITAIICATVVFLVIFGGNGKKGDKE